MADSSLHAELARIAASDKKVATALAEAKTGSATGRQHLVTALEGAHDDVAAIGPHAHTAAGRQALINALTHRINNGRSALSTADDDAQRIANRLHHTGYRGDKSGTGSDDTTSAGKSKSKVGGGGGVPRLTGGGSGSPSSAGTAQPAASSSPAMSSAQPVSSSQPMTTSQPVSASGSQPSTTGGTPVASLSRNTGSSSGGGSSHQRRRSRKHSSADDDGSDETRSSETVSGSDSSSGAKRGRAAARFGLTKVGGKYVWGGNGPRNYDCSGLTRDSWAHAGVHLPRTSQQQFAAVHTHVRRSDVRAGDLVFCEFKNGKPGHVMLAISSTKVVQASTFGVPIHVTPIPTNVVIRRPGAN
ncbi:NlpC/P60 family protein [Tsukamurella sp. 8F]|uniref:C40 family peptidase n=1 Tax=unclassified Tsukamurella TaxID=2633480 RepID=UPI0023B92B1F|nr:MULTISPECIES: C40 family peptidase [unclassified Tsukamurella]MDF0531149.1 NlpC/P60 family protein [Tsukamurella sp. 8J]MDF0588395.1 NlpC/P60 family protein [Tsukamurella sp. 8F]